MDTTIERDGTAVKLLAREINQIVSAPYAVLFGPLSSLLPRIDDFHIHVWTVVKECQVAALASRVLNALEDDEASFVVLLRLITNRRIRDEIIGQAPQILQKLFSDIENENVFETCAALCTHPLPESFAPPPGYFEFIGNILTNERAESSSTWISRVHNILPAIPLSQLNAIDSDTIQTLVSLWNDTCKATENEVFLRFVSIASTIAGYSKSIEADLVVVEPFSTTEKLLVSWTKRCNDLFTGRKAQKLIRSLLLRTLYLVSNEPAETTIDPSEGFLIVKRALERMSGSSLQFALQDQETLPVILKIAQKFGAEPLLPIIRLCISSILSTLDPECKYWNAGAAHALCEDLLCNQLIPSCAVASRRDFPFTRDSWFRENCLDLFTSLGKRHPECGNPIQKVLQLLMSWSRPGIHHNIQTICCVHVCLLIADILDHLIAQTDIDESILKSIAKSDIPDWWDWDLEPYRESTNCAASEVCLQSATLVRYRLSDKISHLVLKSACLSGTRMDKEKFQLFKQTPKSHNLAEAECVCVWPQQSNRHSPLSMQTAVKTRSRACMDADEELSNILQVLNEQASISVNRYVDRVCRDLQHRCQTVEESLRVERAKSADLNKKLFEAQNAIEVLLADHQARRLSWQYELDLEQQKVADLIQSQAEKALSLETLKEQQEEQKRTVQSVETISHQLQLQCQALQTELEDERKIASGHRADSEAMGLEIESLRGQLQEAQGKEERMRCVLRGDEASVPTGTSLS